MFKLSKSDLTFSNQIHSYFNKVIKSSAINFIAISLLLAWGNISFSEDDAKQQANFATINGATFTAGDSTAVIDHLVRLKYASNGQQIDSFYTNGSNEWQFVNVPTPVEVANSGIPDEFTLYQNFPNPFNPHTTILYDLKQAAPVSLKVYDIKGALITDLVNAEQNAGQHVIKWDGKNDHGQQVAEGVYFYRLSAGDFNETKKMIYLHGSVPSSGGNGFQPKESNTGSNHNTINKPLSADYIVEIVNLPGTTPQVRDTSHLFTLENDTSLHVYAATQVAPVAKINLQSLVEMLSGYVPGKYETVQLKQNGNVIQTQNTGENGAVVFNNVEKFLTYTIHVLGDTASRPNINVKDTSFVLNGNTAIEINPELYLRPAVLTNLENKTFNEDELPSEPRIHDLYTKAAGYDSLGNQVNPSTLIYLIQNQSNPNLAPVIIEANQYTKLDGLLPDGNGTNNVTVRAIAPNSAQADKNFNVVVNPMTDISGIVDSLFGNGGAIEGVQIVYGSANATTDATGNYHFQVSPSGTPRTMILNKNGFYERKLSPFAPTGDMTVNANQVDNSINMGFVDETSRLWSGGFQRFENQPTYYINTNPPNGGGTITQAEIDTVLSIINNDLPRFTDSTFQNFTIEMGTNPPAFGTPGYVRVEWDNTIPGAGEHGEYVNGDAISSAYTKLRTGASRGTALQELSQNLGARNDSNIVPSIFNDPSTNSFYLPVDLKLGKFIYNRPLSNSTPDTDH